MSYIGELRLREYPLLAAEAAAPARLLRAAGGALSRGRRRHDRHCVRTRLRRPTAATAASLNNPSSVNNSDGPDKNVEGWFYRHALPFSEGVKISLGDWGVYCVEQLKLLPDDVFLGMFEADKLIVRETAVSL